MSPPRHFLDVTDLDAGELAAVLDLAEIPALAPVLAGKGAALLFEKASTRTRHATEMALFQLGAHPVYTRGEEIGFDERESVEDITRILAGYHAVLCARVYSHVTLTRMAEVADVPVVNLLSDHSHPMQALADVLTMRQLLGPLGRKTVAYVGDYNNVARSLGEASALLGMHVRYGCPPGYDPDEAELDRLRHLGAATVLHFSHPAEAVAGADAVHTDTWVSMGQEDAAVERKRAFDGWEVTEAVMAHAGRHAVFLHCLPAYRGREVSAEVIDGPRSHVFQQGHNRLHTARALFAFLVGVRP